jgi:hypothetical protein
MTEPLVDPDVDRAFFAFDKAKLAFSKGAPGPFQLDGRYTEAVYDRFRDLTEDHWKVAFTEEDNTIFCFGDTSLPHERMAQDFDHLIRVQ